MNLEEEERFGYLVTKQTKKLWSVQLELLSELQRVCNLLKLRVFASGGTLLGGVRHKGFIPWDDDIDVIMFRKDYEILLKEAPGLLNEGFFLQSTYSDKIVRSHAQLRKSGTTCFLKEDYRARYHRGIFIDIFIYDKIPEDENERFFFKQEVMNKWKRIKKPCFVRSNRHSKIVVAFYNCLVIFPKLALWHITNVLFGGIRKRFAKFEKLCGKYNNTNTKYVSNVSFRGINPKTQLLPFKLEWFDDPSSIKFEDYKLLGPSDYDSYLTLQYGNYNAYVVGTSFHGYLFYDTDKNYSDYDKLSYNEFCDLFKN